jgi:hypothetical protein
MLLALALAALLCADSLVHVAERQALGSGRDAALAITRPVQDISHAVGLHLPRLWLAQLTGNEDLPSSSAAGADIDAPSATSVAPLGTNKPKPGGEAAAAVTVPAPTETTLPLRRVPTAEAPLRVLMAGDSLMGTISAGLGRFTRDDPRVQIVADFHVSTGLARPDVLDWPAYLQQRVTEVGAEVVYLAFGGNDDQDMILPDGARAVLGTPEWHAEYTRRVALAMDVAAQDGRTVVWLGLPNERNEHLNAVVGTMNAIALQQADLRPTVHFVDLIPIFTPGGVYRDDVTFPDGNVIDARAADGVHLTHGGADVLAPTLHAVIAAEWHLVEPIAPPTTAAPPPPAPVVLPSAIKPAG